MAVLKMGRTVSVVMTVKNDRQGCALALDSLAAQTRSPDEIVVADGGSDDGTLEFLRARAETDTRLKVLELPGSNIAEGRNAAVQAAAGDIIAATDSGCRADPNWLENLIEPFEREVGVEFVAGVYRIESDTLFESVVGLATMRGQLEPVAPDRFNPSARSLACTKALWRRAGGWPEWIRFSEDTLFDHKVRKMDVTWRLADGAEVFWRPRGSFRALAKQFYRYGTGRGHTQIDAASFAYNLRNVALVAAATVACAVTPWAAVLLSALLVYFYGWTFHGKAVRVARRTGRRLAYPLCMFVMWTVLASNLAGYLVGSMQRWRNRDGYQRRMEGYLAVEQASGGELLTEPRP